MSTHHIILDFDSTFIKVEALDEMAKITLGNNPDSSNILQQIYQITNDGMDGVISLSESLKQRLLLLKGSKNDLHLLVNLLYDQVSDSIKRNRTFIKENADKIYIVSSGFKDYITPIVTQYGIKESNILANNFVFDGFGDIVGIDEDNPLCQDRGKVIAVKNLNLSGIIHAIGDGFTDYEMRKYGVAKYFYAFTENITRQNVVKYADYITSSFDDFLRINNFYPATSYPKNKIKVLLLENIHPTAQQLFLDHGFSLECLAGSLNEDELCAKIVDISILGIRSKTNVTEKVLQHANKLMAIGAFCIGTNQINLSDAEKQGIAVFNAPYSNTRSVVEMVIGEIIVLMRNIIAKNNNLHQGFWDKSANACHEIRGKKIGIIGYGNIGSQLSVLAESLGMQVYYYDLVEKLHLGNAVKCRTLAELLQVSDIVTLHIDGRKNNVNFIGAEEIAQMKDGAVLINLSRGHVVDLKALADSLRSGKLRGAAIDVFPEEPKDNKEKFVHELCLMDNVILTPHIGGSTEEAQFNIGGFVASHLISYINTGSTMQSVNLPNLQLPELNNVHRLIHIHKNVPGILAQINNVLARNNINVLGQYLKTSENIGYVITDIDKGYDPKLIDELKKIDHTIKSRVLY